jgi:hypothetical protein
MLLMLAGPATALPPPPGSPGYVPLPEFVDVDFDDVIETVLKGGWKEAQPTGPPFKFEITGRKPHHFKLRILTYPYCKAVLIDRYALGVGFEKAAPAHDLIKKAELKFDGERKKANCLGMPAWIAFHFASPPNYQSAKVTVRE